MKYPKGALYLKRTNMPDSGSRRLAACSYGKVDGACNLDPKGDVVLNRMEGDFADLHYQPNQYHLHAPSEHTIAGKYYDAELHFVMVPHSATGQAAATFAANQEYKAGHEEYKANYAVLGVMFTKTDCKDAASKDIENCEENLAITKNLFKSMKLEDIPQGKLSPAESHNSHNAPADKVPLKSFMEALNTNEFFMYEGSLTTPPCWEGIRWNMLKNAMPISEHDLNMITRNYAENEAFANLKGNNRVIMPVNDRKVYYMKSAIALAATMTTMSLTAATLF